MTLLMPTRRGFLGGVLALMLAPAIVRASSLMPVQDIHKVRPLILWGDGVHDDAAAIEAFLRGDPVKNALGRSIANVGLLGADDYLPRGIYRIASPIRTLPPVSATMQQDRHEGFVGPISMSGASLLLWDQP